MDLRRQFLAVRAPRSRGLDVVERLVALQAQIPTVPGAALAARVEGLVPEDVARWLKGEKRLLRAWCLRGTLHVFRTEDLPLFYAAVMGGLQAFALRALRVRGGLSSREVRAQDRRVLRALESGPKTRSDLERLGATKRLLWGIEIRSLAHRGLVVHGNSRGGETEFDLLARWAPHARLGDLPPLEARRRLLLRYLDAYGPATVADFAWWTGLRATAVRDAFAAAAREIREVEPGRFARSGDGGGAPAYAGPPRLLPRFDPLVLAHRDKSRYLDPRHRTKVFRPAAVVEATFLVDGRVAGTWTHRPRFALRPFGGLPAGARGALREEYERLRPHLGGGA